MRALAVIPSREEVRLLEHAAPRIEHEHDVKVRSLEVGICGTDKEICSFAYGAPPRGSEYLVLGHESLGEVLEVGGAVSKLKAGDLVVPSVRRPCAHEDCVPCRSGRQDFCVTGDFAERGIKLRHGYMTQYYVENEAYLTVVPPALREVGVLTEPLTVAEKALTQVWDVQNRLPWKLTQDQSSPGAGLRAVVLGAGPVGLLGAMALITRGFKTHVYSRATKPNAKADLVQAIGGEYISSKTCDAQQLHEQVGRIDLVYEAAGVGSFAFDVLQVLGRNGIFVGTGIPAPSGPAPADLDKVLRQLVLKNQVLLGTVNADVRDFQRAVADLGEFRKRWPEQLRSLITGRYPLESYRELLLGHPRGIKNVIALS
jgi:glucose 1-dehydrogenase